jgi:hypothetical protein
MLVEATRACQPLLLGYDDDHFFLLDLTDRIYIWAALMLAHTAPNRAFVDLYRDSKVQQKSNPGRRPRRSHCP